MSTIPDNFNDLFQKKTFAQLATIMSDGSPQVSPVWCEYDGNHVVINSAKGRVKAATCGGIRTLRSAFRIPRIRTGTFH